MRKNISVFITISMLAVITIACTIQSITPINNTPEYQVSLKSTSTESTIEGNNVTRTAIPLPSTPMETPTPQIMAEYVNLSPSISEDGQFVVFITNSRTVLDDNAPVCYFDSQRQTLCHQVVRYNTKSRQFLIVSSSLSNAGLGNQISQNTGQAVSADGRRVVFASFANNLTENANPGSNIFLRDLNKNEIYNLTDSISDNGASYSQDASISADGNYIVFASTSQQIGGIAAQVGWNVYLYDVSTGRYTLVSSGVRKPEDFGDSLKPSISSNGRWVAFWSWAGLVQGDDSPCAIEGDVANPCGDIYRYDIQTGQLTRFAIGAGHGIGGEDIPETHITNSGRWILAGDTLLDLSQNVSENLYVKFERQVCGMTLSKNTDSILYLTHDQLSLLTYDLSNNTIHPLFDIMPKDYLTDADRSVCEIGAVFTGLLSASSDNRMIAFVSARGLDVKDVSICQDSILKPYNCLDIYFWAGEGLSLDWIAP